jgi:hypothetical protein
MSPVALVYGRQIEFRILDLDAPEMAGFRDDSLTTYRIVGVTSIIDLHISDTSHCTASVAGSGFQMNREIYAQCNLVRLCPDSGCKCGARGSVWSPCHRCELRREES